MPELTDIKAGDLVDIIIWFIHNGTYQLRVGSADDITKTELGPDTEAPVIEHTPITKHINLDLEIKKVTDDREVEKLNYSIKQKVIQNTKKRKCL